MDIPGDHLLGPLQGQRLDSARSRVLPSAAALFVLLRNRPGGGRAWTRPSVRYPDELDLLVVAAHGLLLDVTQSGHVVLVLRDAGVDLRAGLHRQQGARVGPGGHFDGPAAAEHPSLIESVAREVLLAVLDAWLRGAGHDDPRLGPVDACLPGVAHLHEVAVPDLPCVLAHV